MVRLLRDSSFSGGKQSTIQGSDANERGIEISILLSAKNSDILWSLRCETWEKLIHFIPGGFPNSLPKVISEYRLVTIKNQLIEKVAHG